MKYLLLAAFLFAMFRVLRMARGARPVAPRSVSRVPERMVQCACCGVYQPLGESIRSDGRHYCCAEHRRVAEARRAGES